MKSLFLDKLAESFMICDGAMGTYLNQKGVPYEHCFDELNLSRPELVGKVHLEYISAGAEIIETNTFGANAARLSNYGLESKVREINIKAGKIAREARDVSGREVLVAGSVGPLGKRIGRLGKITAAAAAEMFEEQAAALLEAGIDLFILETMSNLEEMIIAIASVRKLTDLPLVAQMTFTEEGVTLHGNTPAEVATGLAAEGADVVGANCSVGPQAMLEVINEFFNAGARLISAQPNAGLPRMYDGRFMYFTQPDYFARYAKEFVESGVKIIGGCCGTTPEHIAAIAEKLKHFRPSPQPESSKSEITDKFSAISVREDRPITPSKSAKYSRFLEKLKTNKIISVEIDPPKGSNSESMIKSAAALKEAGADAINIADSPLARIRMSCLASAYLIRQHIDIDIILHFTTRDRNLMGLQSDLLGAHALGIRDILALTGDPPSLGDYPQATAVYDVDSIGLVGIISKMNSGFDFFDNSIGKGTEFSIGVAANPTAPDYKLEMARLERKINAGGQYIFTQPIYDMQLIEKFLKDCDSFGLPIILGVLPLVSHKHAEFLHNEVPGISIPDQIRSRMLNAGDRSRLEGQKIALELIDSVGDKVAGFYLMPSFNKFDTCLDIIRVLRRTN